MLETWSIQKQFGMILDASVRSSTDKTAAVGGLNVVRVLQSEVVYGAYNMS
jgi:hypothetical protein